MSGLRCVVRRALFMPRVGALLGVLAILFALCAAPALKAQEFPNWSTYTENPSITMFYTGYLVPYVSPQGTPALVLVYTDTYEDVDVAYTTDGVHYTEVARYYMYQMDCNQGYIDVCSPAAAVLDVNGVNTLYIAFPNGDQGISVIAGTPNGGTYTFTSVYSDNSVQLTSSPAMIVSPNGNLLIKYGTSNNPNVNNATYLTDYDPSTNAWSTYASGGEANTATRSGMVVFDGNIYTIDKQNNSDNGTWLIELDDNGYVVTGFQIPGMYTGLGYSAAVFNGSIVATLQQNASSHYLWVFSSSDPLDQSSWSGKEYSAAQVGATPIVGLWNGGLALAFEGNGSYHYLWSSFATE